MVAITSTPTGTALVAVQVHDWGVSAQDQGITHAVPRRSRPAVPQLQRCDEKGDHLFITCPIAVAKRAQWAADSLRGITVTADQQLQLWDGSLGPWVSTHRLKSLVYKAATDAVSCRIALAGDNASSAASQPDTASQPDSTP